MNTFLWVLQILVILHAIIGAVWKFSNSEQAIPSLKIIPHKVWLGISLFEVLCGLCLIVPALSLIVPAFNIHLVAILAPIGAVCIAIEMLFFSGMHIYSGSAKHGSPGPMIYWLVVAVVCVFIAYARVALEPFL
ncbi:MAG: hypothetical protein V4591_09155 [Bdellovibrionota bacterium]